MTEAEWLECNDAAWMRYQLKRQVQSRKELLFLSASFRRSWNSLPPVGREYVSILEQVAEGAPQQEKLKELEHAVDEWFWENHFSEQDEAFAYPLWQIGPTGGKKMENNDDTFYACENRALANLVRDIFGNPFRPVTCDSAWRTATVTSLAQGIYDDRRFADLPILADALEDAGCTSADVLEHCRTPGEHVRGCWVVDLALGKE